VGGRSQSTFDDLVETSKGEGVGEKEMEEAALGASKERKSLWNFLSHELSKREQLQKKQERKRGG